MTTTTRHLLQLQWQPPQSPTTTTASTTLLFAGGGGVRTRGLEKRRQGITPTEGDMILYCKAGPDTNGTSTSTTSIGDCPFCHFVRLVLEEKQLAYELKPCTAETKPKWLVESYQGKLPCLRHSKQAYVESSIIVEYLEFFFPLPSLAVDSTLLEEDATQSANDVLEGFFPTVAKYLKDTTDNNEETLRPLNETLTRLNQHLIKYGTPWMVGETFTLLDCRLLPQLYHLQIGSEGFHHGIPNVQNNNDDYPAIASYYQQGIQRPSFQTTMYPKETVLWGWGTART